MRTQNKLYPNVEAQTRVADWSFWSENGNQILSPGQVLIKRDKIPTVWCENIISVSGADDFFLWILMLKGGARFGINESCLYTHVENGCNTSDSRRMIASVQEVIENLKQAQILETKELQSLERQLETMKAPGLKFLSMAKVYDQWMNMKSKGTKVEEYFRKKRIFLQLPEPPRIFGRVPGGYLSGNQDNGVIPMYQPKFPMRKIFRVVITGKKYYIRRERLGTAGGQGKFHYIYE
jgi:hypothetical protein